MKLKPILLFLPLISLTACTSSKEISRESFYFDTYQEIKLYEGNNEDLDEINKIFTKIDKLTDNFNARDLNNIYYINNTNENVQIEPELYDCLRKSFCSCLDKANFFNPLCGSLSKKWKEALANNQILSETQIQSELSKMANTQLEFPHENVVRRVGESEIDLGAVAKGYALDKAKEYLDDKGYTKYLIDNGSSSILLGEKSNGKNFIIKISDLEKKYISAKNCYISTSSLSRQKVVIDNQAYSHIINPVNGSAINLHDTVIVLSQSGYLGDILSTDFINESLDSISQLEAEFNVKTIVIDSGRIVYQNDAINVSDK